MPWQVPCSAASLMLRSSRQPNDERRSGFIAFSCQTLLVLLALFPTFNPQNELLRLYNSPVQSIRLLKPYIILVILSKYIVSYIEASEPL